MTSKISTLLIPHVIFIVNFSVVSRNTFPDPKLTKIYISVVNLLWQVNRRSLIDFSIHVCSCLIIKGHTRYLIYYLISSDIMRLGFLHVSQYIIDTVIFSMSILYISANIDFSTILYVFHCLLIFACELEH